MSSRSYDHHRDAKYFLFGGVAAAAMLLASDRIGALVSEYVRDSPKDRKVGYCLVQKTCDTHHPLQASSVRLVTSHKDEIRRTIALEKILGVSE